MGLSPGTHDNEPWFDGGESVVSSYPPSSLLERERMALKMRPPLRVAGVNPAHYLSEKGWL